MDANMIPVVNKASNGTYPSSWCNYDSKQWCNAVTIRQDKLDQYKTATVGTEIPEDDILGYWTYIPRYAYQVQRYAQSDAAITTPTLFQIVFQKAGTSTCTASNKPIAGSSTKCNPEAKGQWATHPAFTFGTTELNGIWVGKFETSSPDDTGSTTAANTQVTANNVFIKPNQYTLNYQNVSTQFKVARAMGIVSTDEQANLKMNGSSGILNGVGSLTIPQNTQNLTASTNTRMLKNSDWGAIVYLSASAYGAGVTTDNYGAVQINANSTSYGITGCGPAGSGLTTTYAGTVTCKPTSGNITDGKDRSYYTTYGILASTTNNVYGIYDMNGGSWEYTVANYNKSSGYYCESSTADFSGFAGACPGSGNPNPAVASSTVIGWGSTGFEAKYYNIYTFTAQSGCTFATCGGHALYETASWNADYANFVSSTVPWFERGGFFSNGSSAGLFASGNYDGYPIDSIGFRVLQSAK
jgi:hypothetical protein